MDLSLVPVTLLDAAIAYNLPAIHRFHGTRQMNEPSVAEIEEALNKASRSFPELSISEGTVAARDGALWFEAIDKTGSASTYIAPFEVAATGIRFKSLLVRDEGADAATWNEKGLPKEGCKVVFYVLTTEGAIGRSIELAHPPGSPREGGKHAIVVPRSPRPPLLDLGSESFGSRINAMKDKIRQWNENRPTPATEQQTIDEDLSAPSIPGPRR